MPTEVFKTGKVDSSEKMGSKTNGFVSIKPGQTIALVPMLSLDKMISADFHEFWESKPPTFHPCIGENCPSCELLEHKPRFKGYLPVVSKTEDKEAEVKIWAFPITVYQQLELLDDELDNGIGGYLLKFSRTGSGKTGTRYTVTTIGKKVDIKEFEVPEFVNILGPITVKGIKELLAERGIIEDSDAPKAEDEQEDDWGDL